MCKNALAEALTSAPPGSVAECNILPEFCSLFVLESPLIGMPAILCGFCNSRRTHIGGDYALIAAISGWMPMMFMTRVIL